MDFQSKTLVATQFYLSKRIKLTQDTMDIIIILDDIQKNTATKTFSHTTNLCTSSA